MNILTFDIEEWFHLLDNDSTRSEEQWKGFEVRIYENMERIFRILEETDTKATFFVIGWIAKTYPDIVRQIASKYQVGSHTMNHQLVWQQSKEAQRGCLFFHKIAGGYNGTEGRGFSCAGLLDP